jgi:hypothetical protein
MFTAEVGADDFRSCRHGRWRRGPACGTPYPLWAGVCWIMVKMLAVQIPGILGGRRPIPLLAMPGQGGCGRHRWAAGAAGAPR